jgi:hypothetical protein
VSARPGNGEPIWPISCYLIVCAKRKRAKSFDRKVAKINQTETTLGYTSTRFLSIIKNHDAAVLRCALFRQLRRFAGLFMFDIFDDAHFRRMWVLRIFEGSE